MLPPIRRTLAVDQVTQPSFEDTFSKHSQRWMNPIRLTIITLIFVNLSINVTLDLDIDFCSN